MKVKDTALVIAVAAGLLSALPVAEAQSTPRVYRIGVLFEGTSMADMAGPNPTSLILRSFLDGLRELGYVEGQNVLIERHSAEGKAERLPGLAAELVRKNPDLILASGEQTTPVVLAATAAIPIVQPTLTDPVERGYAKTLARPGGNLTGISLQADRQIYAKMLELLKEAAPKISRVAVIHRTSPVSGPSPTLVGAIQPAADRLQVSLLSTVVERDNEFAPAFARIGRERADALIAELNGLNTRRATSIVQFSARSRLPAASGTRGFAEEGGLLSYGPNVAENFRRAAVYADKILKGGKPGDMPIEQPTKFELVINLKTAKALGLTMSPSLLVRADKVIE
jgi:putative ABC transport system substrate-binding protein